MDKLVTISKEKKIEGFRMVIMPSGRNKIGLIQTKDYGIVTYPNKKDFEKIGEMINWVFNESDDKVIEISPNIKFHKQFYNCSSFRKVLNEYNEVWFDFFKGIYRISLLRKQGNAYVIFENENKEAVECIFPEKPTALELGTKVMEMFEYKERYDGLIE
ncbi:osmolarity sensor protein EnvZ [Fusobacterium polymorphum]|uniref:Osmolarity sensor protein EnvZ n=1 Tax=Fusobacterium nucleatum subsp. polymorphum TaxID=76857 RepID=A0A241Q0A6_FUSNP|nr:osmolarity sensor protein EnvZ [Fusobacterium polymorphum]ASG28224.1 osmolarity sensor protein EnvZ [Fusobacterium polymorphum]